MDFYTICIYGGGWSPYALKLKVKNLSLDTLSFDYTLKDIRTASGFPKRQDYINSIVRLAPNGLIEQRMDTVYGDKAFDGLEFSMSNLTRKR